MDFSSATDRVNFKNHMLSQGFDVLTLCHEKITKGLNGDESITRDDITHHLMMYMSFVTTFRDTVKK